MAIMCNDFQAIPTEFEVDGETNASNVNVTCKMCTIHSNYPNKYFKAFSLEIYSANTLRNPCISLYQI
jgi:hypothetical protein